MLNVDPMQGTPADFVRTHAGRFMTVAYVARELLQIFQQPQVYESIWGRDGHVGPAIQEALAKLQAALEA